MLPAASTQKLLLLLVTLSWATAVRGQNANVTGVTVFRAATTNLFGNGIRVAQPEAVDTGQEDYEVNPADVGQSSSLFSYTDSSGSSSTYPNAYGTNAYHPERVASFFYSTIPVGSAPAGIATNVAHVDCLDANWYMNHYVYTGIPINLGDAIVNMSFSYGTSSGVSFQQSLDTYMDNYAVQYGALFVASVGVTGAPAAPGTSYDCISVAAFNPGANSAVGPTLDNLRCKPDLTAPDPNTSFSVPQVAGAAAVLMQAGGRGDGGPSTNASTNMITLKALLLNGTVKPLGWTNGPATPLDARYGAGMLDLYNSYRELAGGRHTNQVTTTVSTGGAHPPNGNTNTVPVLSGWDFNTNTSSALNDAINHYYFNVSNSVSSASFVASATLVWNRHANTSGINNLRLYLYNTANSNLVNCSTSAVDNVQHFYNPRLAPGRYDLQVWKAGGIYVSAAEPYALAYAFVQPPKLTTLHTTNNVTVAWPAYPDGYQLQYTTNLLNTNSWSTNYLAFPTISNQMNLLTFSPTNKIEAFRLVSPNF